MGKILITGINGFTGRYFLNFLKTLKIKNLVIYGIDRTKFPVIAENLHFIKVDLFNRTAVFKIIKTINPDYIFHFAGLNFSRNYEKLLSHNVFLAKNLLDAVVNTKGRPRILIIGSAAEYGVTARGPKPITEKTPLNPITPYGVSKATQDLLALQYHAEFGLNIIIGRPFNIIGPGQTTNLVCGSMVKQIKNISVNRSRVNELVLGNLHTKRDFIDIRDVVRAYWKLMMCKKAISGEIFNIGNGKAYSIREIAKILIGYCERPIVIKQKKIKIRKRDISFQVADITKIRNLIGWFPSIPIELSLRDMYMGIK